LSCFADLIVPGAPPLRWIGRGKRWDPESIVSEAGELIVAAEHHGTTPLRSSLVFGAAAGSEPDLPLLVLLLRLMQAIYDAPS